MPSYDPRGLIHLPCLCWEHWARPDTICRCSVLERHSTGQAPTSSSHPQAPGAGGDGRSPTAGEAPTSPAVPLPEGEARGGGSRTLYIPSPHLKDSPALLCLWLPFSATVPQPPSSLSTSQLRPVRNRASALPPPAPAFLGNFDGAAFSITKIPNEAECDWQTQKGFPTKGSAGNISEPVSLRESLKDCDAHF